LRLRSSPSPRAVRLRVAPAPRAVRLDGAPPTIRYASTASTP
jgi:hypothetical protein